jgi:hypothetical protein|tara:strand:+ start:1219 stop:1551 length:333 start_codon:yes stop_codon:yes gene_type:complete
MSENKELLEATVKGLQEKIQQLNVDLKSKQQELEDVNKPEITAVQMDAINDAVNTVLERFEFDCGMFEYEFNLGYDNKLELSDLTFTDAYDLEESIMRNITNQFKVLKDD